MECDCLNRCGDDPWIKDGRSEPCENLLAARLKDQQAKERAEKVEQIATRYGTKGILSLLDLIIILDKKIEQLTVAQLPEHATPQMQQAGAEVEIDMRGVTAKPGTVGWLTASRVWMTMHKAGAQP